MTALIVLGIAFNLYITLKINVILHNIVFQFINTGCFAIYLGLKFPSLMLFNFIIPSLTFSLFQIYSLLHNSINEFFWFISWQLIATVGIQRCDLSMLILEPDTDVIYKLYFFVCGFPKFSLYMIMSLVKWQLHSVFLPESSRRRSLG